MANVRVRKAAEHLGLSKSTLDKLRIYGGGPTFMRLGRAVVYSTSDLDKWLSERRVASNDNQQARAAA